MNTAFALLLCCLFLVVNGPRHAQAQESPNERKLQAQRVRRTARGLSLLAASGASSLLRADMETAANPPRLRNWIQRNQDALLGAKPDPFRVPSKWGVCSSNSNRLYLHIHTWPKNGKLVLPRLNNSILSVTFTHQDDSLKVTPEVDQWIIQLPTSRPQVLLPVLKLELDRPPHAAQTKPLTVLANKDGEILLHARYAQPHGELLRFEPQPHKNTIGYWANADDWVEWSFRADPGRTYEVTLRYGCGAGQGGSEIELAFGSQTKPYQVEATGGFQNWREVNLGPIEGLEGLTKVRVHVKEKAQHAVMDIQQISLRPLK